MDPTYGAQQAHCPAESRRRRPLHQSGTGLSAGPIKAVYYKRFLRQSAAVGGLVCVGGV